MSPFAARLVTRILVAVGTKLLFGLVMSVLGTTASRPPDSFPPPPRRHNRNNQNQRKT